jgi:hypothetical protein
MWVTSVIMHYIVLLVVDHSNVCWFLGMVEIFPVGCRCVLVYLGCWPSALCFAWWSPASDRIPSGAVFICRWFYLAVGRVLYVFGESWIGVGLGVRQVVCTVNCGGTHYYAILILIPVYHTRYYMIVNSDTRDQHQYSVIVSATTIHSAHHPTDIQARTEPRLTKHIQHAVNWETDSTTNEYGSRRYLSRSRGTITLYTTHPVNDLDTPIYTGIQLKNSAPSPKSTHIRVIYIQQYKIVHNDTSDLHQHSVK